MDIQGNAGVALVAEGNSNVNITLHQYSGNASDAEIQKRKEEAKLKFAVAQLFGLIKKHDLKESIEEISSTLFGDKTFNNLTVEQVKQLQLVASVFTNTIDEIQQTNSKRHELEEKEVFTNIGIRTNAVERAAIDVLLSDRVNSMELKRVWNDFLLSLGDDNQFKLTQPKKHLIFGWSALVAGLVIVLVFLFSAVGAYNKLAVLHIHAGLALIPIIGVIAFTGMYFVWISKMFLDPYYTAKKIKPYVERVNEKLRQKNNKEFS
jgi:hypothetical protein